MTTGGAVCGVVAARGARETRPHILLFFTRAPILPFLTARLVRIHPTSNCVHWNPECLAEYMSSSFYPNCALDAVRSLLLNGVNDQPIMLTGASEQHVPLSQWCQ